MHFFITGHTGFKGSWLVLFLKELGHQVSGYSLAAVSGGLFDQAGLEKDLLHHNLGDVRDAESLKKAVRNARPDVAIHMAAQPLVLYSYANPLETFTTNVSGTLNFLDAISSVSSSPLSLVITTDKVYRNTGLGSYKESDALGGDDPYSSSKAMADILAQSWSASYKESQVLVGRAGNVVGAFDVSSNRLLPDITRAAASGEALLVRNPQSIRPWQHVLDCLTGYLLYIDKALEGKAVSNKMNFGPEPSSFKSVTDVLDVALEVFPRLQWHIEGQNPLQKETDFLTLDSSLAQQSLNWMPQIPFREAIELSLVNADSVSARSRVKSQIQNFLASSPIIKPLL